MSPVAWTAIGCVAIAIVFGLAFLLAPDLFHRDRDYGVDRDKTPSHPPAPAEPEQRTHSSHRRRLKGTKEPS